MRVELEELRALAEAATPGPWGDDGPWWWDEFCTSVITTHPGREAVTVVAPKNPNAAADAAFIAAANPSTVIALLDRIEELEGALRTTPRERPACCHEMQTFFDARGALGKALDRIEELEAERDDCSVELEAANANILELEELRALAEHDVKFSMVTAPYPASTVLSLLDRIEELEGTLRACAQRHSRSRSIDGSA